MNSDMIWQILRYVLLAGGGYFVNKGVITSDGLTTALASLGTLFTFAWGIYVKYGTKATPQAIADKPSVPTVSAATGQVTK